LILIRRLAYVALFFEVGFLLVVLPWSDFWERNYFAVAWSAVHSIAMNNFVRGAVSGLGVVNLAAGFAELVAALTARERSGVSLGDGTGT
jgi:hypothetical protein